MNYKAIIKIIVWSTVAFIFVAVMFLISISGNFIDFITDSFSGNVHNTKTARKTELDVNDINNIDIEWAYGNVYISTYDGDKIIIDERSNKDLDKDELTNINQEDETLYLKQPHNFNFFNLFGSINKKLVRYIKLPTKLYNKIKTEFTSGSLQVNDVQAKEVSFKMTSGNAVVSLVTSQSLIIDMTSGNIEVDGFFKDIKAYATSGNMEISSNLAPSNLLVDITSGKATVSIPDNDGFTLSKERTSGMFKNDFKLDDYNTYRNGKYNYKIKMTSGMVNLLKKD
jgi:lia operon protein LiaG